eukprot:187878-Hanusia_phi.AAC.1
MSDFTGSDRRPAGPARARPAPARSRVPLRSPGRPGDSSRWTRDSDRNCQPWFRRPPYGSGRRSPIRRRTVARGAAAA